MTKQFDTILFDLDGTLVDSGEGIMKSAQYALDKLGIHVDDWHALRPFVGPPLEDSFKDFYHLDDQQAELGVEGYRERYFATGVYEQKEYPGVYEFLEELRSRGYRLALATSKMQRLAKKVTEEIFHLADHLDYVFGRDDEGIRHTKADVINYGLTTMGITDRSRVLMIGDRKFDINGAKECGLTSVGVLFGYGDREELQTAGADYICSSYDEILALL